MATYKKTIIKTAGIISMIGVSFVILGDIMGTIVYDEHNPIRDTISMLAEGPHAWIQDVGIDALAIGVLLLAIGLYVWRSVRSLRWVAGLICLAVIAVTLVIIAEGNRFANPENQTHMYLVYVLAGSFLLATFLLRSGLEKLHPALKRFSSWMGGVWIVLSPFFFVVPDNLDGGYERLISIILISWVAVIGYNLFKNGHFDGHPG